MYLAPFLSGKRGQDIGERDQDKDREGGPDAMEKDRVARRCNDCAVHVTELKYCYDDRYA